MKKKTIVSMITAVVLLWACSAGAQQPGEPSGPGRLGGPGGPGGPGHRMGDPAERGFGQRVRQLLADNPECAKKLEQITAVKQELKQIRNEIAQLEWDRTEEELRKLAKQEPEKSGKIRQLIQTRKKIKLQMEEMLYLREEVRNLSQELELPPQLRGNLMGKRPQMERSGPLGQNITRRLLQRRQQMKGEALREQRKEWGEQRKERVEQRLEQRREGMLEKLAEENPEKYRLVEKQADTTKRLQGLMDELVDLLAEQVETTSDTRSPGKN